MHAEPCRGADGTFPTQLEQVDQVLRPYGEHDGRRNVMVYDLVRLVPAGGGLEQAVQQILADPRVERVLSHNVMHGCYSFTARRLQP